MSDGGKKADVEGSGKTATEGKKVPIFVGEIGDLLGMSSPTVTPVKETLPKDLAPHPGRTAIANAARDRAGRNSNFEMRYTEEDLDRLTAAGQHLGLDDKTVEDLIYIGSRNDIKYRDPPETGPEVAIPKRLSAEALEAQMVEWAKVVKPRGYPHRFKSKEEYQRFSDRLIDEVTKAGLPAGDIRVQGSSLRKTEAKDVDIVVFITKDKFAGILTNHFKDQSMRKKDPPPTGKKVSKVEKIPGLAEMNYDQLSEAVRDITTNPGNYNAVAKQLKHAMESGIMNSKHAFSPTKAITSTIASQFPDANIESVSIEIGGGGFDLSPSLTLAHS